MTIGLVGVVVGGIGVAGLAVCVVAREVRLARARRAACERMRHRRGERWPVQEGDAAGPLSGDRPLVKTSLAVGRGSEREGPPR